MQEKKDLDEALEIKKRKRLERDPLHQGLIVQRANLKPRDFQIDLAAKLHKSQVVSVTMPLSQQAGYYCSVCDCVLRDSMSYLDHLNGKWHNRALGMSMRVEKSTAEQVRSRLEEAKRKKEGGTSESYAPDGGLLSTAPLRPAHALRTGPAADGQRPALGAQCPAPGAQCPAPDAVCPAPGAHVSPRRLTLLPIAAGFEKQLQKQQEEEEEERRKRRKSGCSDSEEEEEEEGVDPEMSAMMGFGGFGTSKK